jgi:hypothetical protein
VAHRWGAQGALRIRRDPRKRSPAQMQDDLVRDLALGSTQGFAVGRSNSSIVHGWSEVIHKVSRGGRPKGFCSTPSELEALGKDLQCHPKMNTEGLGLDLKYERIDR